VADPSETTQIGRLEQDPPASGTETGEVLEAIRELSARVGGMQSELQTLRAQARVLPPSADEAAGWEEARESSPDLLTWVRALDAPGARGPSVPRLFLEIVFLVCVAVGSAIAELELVEILAVMAGAWALVAVAEVVGARAARRRADAVYAPAPGVVPGYPTDPSWFTPPVERPELDVLEETGEPRAKLPPPSED
jgi:hypothetical protein